MFARALLLCFTVTVILFPHFSPVDATAIHHSVTPKVLNTAGFEKRVRFGSVLRNGNGELLTKPHRTTLNRALDAYTNGVFVDTHNFIKSIARGLPELLPADVDYHASVDYFAVRHSNKPQPGARVILRADTRKSELKLPRSRFNHNQHQSDPLVNVELLFGCSGFKYSEFGRQLSLDYDGEEQAVEMKGCPSAGKSSKCQCTPHVHIEDVFLDSSLLGRGFTSRLLLNIMNIMEAVSFSDDSKSVVIPPQISTVAYTCPQEACFGAAYLAFRGFQFASEEERNRLIGRMFDWLRWFSGARPVNKWSDVREYIEAAVEKPVDLLQLDLTGLITGVSNTAEIGKTYFESADVVMWEGYLTVDTLDENYLDLKRKLVQTLNNKRVSV